MTQRDLYTSDPFPGAQLHSHAAVADTALAVRHLPSTTGIRAAEGLDLTLR